MSRVPSDKTRLATLRRDTKRLERELGDTRAALMQYRLRATKAEQDVAEWITRFDRLLKFRKVDNAITE